MSRKQIRALAEENGWRHSIVASNWDEFYSDWLGRKHISVCWINGRIECATLYVNAAVWEYGQMAALKRWLTNREVCVEHRWLPVHGTERRISYGHWVAMREHCPRCGEERVLT